MEIKNHLKLLLLEKNASVGQLLCEYMQISDFRADMFTSTEDAYHAFIKEGYPICIISIEESTSEEDFTLVKRIRSVNPDVILIFLATNPTMEVITQAYALGADDFVRKPFILEELQLRINAIIRRSRNLDIQVKTCYRIGKYSLDTKKQTLSIGDTCNKITTKECDLLMFLCENMNNLVLREDILKTVWKNNSYYNARSMDVYITKLRRLLKGDNRAGIINVHGKGYKLLVI
ncbi:MAG: response regulator transcription factor [Tannerellaceae bacterium]|nr:response regulator transcription factor [Tannerellaceae bacterium]